MGWCISPSWFGKKGKLIFTQHEAASGKSHLIYQVPKSFVMQIVLLFSFYQQFNLGQDWLTRMFANQFETRLGWGPVEVCQNLPSKDKVHSWSHFGNAFAHYLIIWSTLYGPHLKLQLLFWRHSRGLKKKDSQFRGTDLAILWKLGYLAPLPMSFFFGVRRYINSYELLLSSSFYMLTWQHLLVR